MSKPYKKVHIEISNICNLQCSFCPAVIRDNQMMDLELFKQIVQQVAPLTELICFHLMGDPLVHPKLKEMVEICEFYQTKIFFVTNGVLLKPDKFELLLNSAFYQINFSLHSFFDNFPEKDPTRYLQRVFDFTEQAFVHRPDMYINYRLWNLNDPLGTQTSNHQMLTKVCEQFDFPVPQQVNVKSKKSFRVKNRLYLHFDTEFVWPSVDLPVLGTHGTCYGLTSHFGILVDGTVVPCCLDKEAAIPLGNARQQPITEILASPRARNILQGFKQKKLVENLCQKCQYIERFGATRIPIKL